MSLGDAIAKATARVVPKLIGAEGFARSTVTTTRYAKERDSAARPKLTPANPIKHAKWYIREIADARVQRVWGLNSSASAEAQVTIDADVAENDVVLVEAGDFVGETYEIEQMRREPLANRIVLALAPTGQTPQ